MLDKYNNDDNNGGNNRSKFNDRLKKIRRERLKFKTNDGLDENKFSIKYTGRNIFKVILVLPSFIYSHITGDNKKIDIDSKKNNDSVNDDKRSINNDYLTQDLDYSEKVKRIKVNNTRDFDVSLLKKNKELFFMRDKIFDGDIEANINSDIEIRKEKIQREILHLIKKKLVKSINELEMLQSDLYVLNQLSNGEIYLNDCQQDIKEIKKLLSKVNSLKEKYDYLKDNVDFEYMLEYDDNFLIDKIVELKEICSREDVKHIIDDYKILDEYKYLYLKIDKLQDDAIKYEEYKNNKVRELKQRDIDFDKMKEQLYDIDSEKDRYDKFVREQEFLLNELNDKVGKIDSYESVTYRLKGFNKLLGNSFKYLGLLLVNPLKGLVPSIAVQTLVTKNMVKNLYNNLEWEEVKRMVYDAIDYSVSINAMINDLDNMSLMINSTLNDIIYLKNKYINDFSKYENSFSGYKDAIKRLNKIENAVLGNKIKIEMLQVKMKEKERENSNKLKMVKKLNAKSE